MHQCIICPYLDRKSLLAQAIQDELMQVLGFDVIVYSTMASYRRAPRCRPLNAERHSYPPDVIHKAVFQAIDEIPFTFVRELAKSTCIPRAFHVHSTCIPRAFHVHSTYNSLTMPSRVLRIHCQAFTFGPPPSHRYTITNSSRSIDWLIHQSNELFRISESVQNNGWQNLMALDESWFYLWTSHEIVSVQTGQPFPER
jgi:hypothetical protein